MEIQEYIVKQKSDLKVLQDLDFKCKENNQIIGRFISVGFADRKCLYVVVDETSSKYLLRFAWGESVHPDYGTEIKLNKKEVEEMILGRDHIETIFPPPKSGMPEIPGET